MPDFPPEVSRRVDRRTQLRWWENRQRRKEKRQRKF